MKPQREGQFYSSRLLSNSGVLPAISFRKNSRLNSKKKVNITIIKPITPNKSHGWDNISSKRTKMCVESLTLPIFEAALNGGFSPDDWKQGNIVPVHKKD